MSQHIFLPFEILCEIARAEWYAWGALKTSCKRLHVALNEDPYELFTTRKVIDPCLDEIWAGWYTSDNTLMRVVIRSICGFLLIWTRAGKAAWYDHETIFNRDPDGNVLWNNFRFELYIDHYRNVDTIDDISNLILDNAKYEFDHRETITEEQITAIRELYSRDKLLSP